jgi:LysM repeat protein
MEDRTRVWATRILAPIAFLAAATVLVILVQRALENDSGTTAQTTTVPVTSDGAGAGGAADTGASADGPQYYRIRAGDTLDAIAARFDTTVDRLLQLNPGIDPLSLTPRERIRVA